MHSATAADGWTSVSKSALRVYPGLPSRRCRHVGRFRWRHRASIFLRHGGWRRAGRKNLVSTALTKKKKGYGAHVVEEELVIACHFWGLLVGVGCLLAGAVSARSFWVDKKSRDNGHMSTSA